ncbi:hypothetical protein HDU87_004652 [Geranomyces variabilis]|uniref:Uncharacterized protein n=1 Tax=Geranomyces variabilis TaxID=109894 RepID=A0AAD5TI49_9FUNG|nr:hypothetical protein HDU87_004652 [Geranomyces variabilis]
MATPTTLSALAAQHDMDLNIISSLSQRLKNKEILTFGKIVGLKVVRKTGITNERLAALIQGSGFQFTPPLAVNQMPTEGHIVAAAGTTISSTRVERRIKESLSARIHSCHKMTMGEIAKVKVVRESGMSVKRLCELLDSWGFVFSPPLAVNEMPEASHIVSLLTSAKASSMDGPASSTRSPSAAQTTNQGWASTTPSAPTPFVLASRTELESRIQASVSARLKDKGLIMTFGEIAALKVVRKSEVSNKRLGALIRGWGYVIAPPLAANALPDDSHIVATATVTKTPAFIKAIDNLAVKAFVPSVSVNQAIAPSAEPVAPAAADLPMIEKDPLAELSINTPYIREWLAVPVSVPIPERHRDAPVRSSVATAADRRRDTLVQSQAACPSPNDSHVKAVSCGIS